jgi:hypothetical protein
MRKTELISQDLTSNPAPEPPFLFCSKRFERSAIDAGRSYFVFLTACGSKGVASNAPPTAARPFKSVFFIW